MDLSLFKDKKVLITGGLGFIGSNLARRLVALGANVTLIDSLIPEYGGNLFNISGIEDKVKINISDIRDEHSMKYLVKEKDFLFNLAGQTSHMDSMKDPYTDLEINTKAQLFILEACRKNNPNVKIIFASTRQIYGKPRYLPVDEKHPLAPVDVNGINKLSGETYHLLYREIYGIPTCVLRLTNTIGPGMRIKDTRQTFLGIWIRAVIEGRPFEVWNGSQLRDFSYVDDVVEACLISASNERAYGKIFNLGGDCVVSLKELADLLIKVNKEGTYIVKEFPGDRKVIDIGDYYGDYGLINALLGWKPKISLEEALKKTLDYYRININKYIQ
ncbi:MAG TPA: GDP-mannose 4,6-dehydratase [Candidatus Eremiobacteraeota bacterium]|mgnify:CR=1 FL=1|nr:GDP-mannose 4,6-dehydratase [Candidatus Eremiobacteraeota bacterium]